MAGPVMNLVMKIVRTGVEIGMRSVAQALRKEGAARAAAQGPKGSATSQAAQAVKDKMQGKMKLEEARSVLNVKPEASPDEVAERFQYLFNINDHSKGGSFYLQSKIYRAKQCLDQHLGVPEAPVAGSGESASAVPKPPKPQASKSTDSSTGPPT